MKRKEKTGHKDINNPARFPSRPKQMKAQRAKASWRKTAEQLKLVAAPCLLRSSDVQIPNSVLRGNVNESPYGTEAPPRIRKIPKTVFFLSLSAFPTRMAQWRLL